ncbi:MAG: hypothetical protein NT027_06865 [Proteobacteria bacterium]|nr:hypothetical protein [Pseudomonadota bacterium]
MLNLKVSNNNFMRLKFAIALNLVVLSILSCGKKSNSEDTPSGTPVETEIASGSDQGQENENGNKNPQKTEDAGTSTSPGSSSGNSDTSQPESEATAKEWIAYELNYKNNCMALEQPGNLEKGCSCIAKEVVSKLRTRNAKLTELESLELTEEEENTIIQTCAAMF